MNHDGPIDGHVSKDKFHNEIQHDRVQREEARNDPRLDWFRAARFGAFIHWGLYALPNRWTDRKQHRQNWAEEWKMYAHRVPVKEYEQYAKDFNPVEFDADAWAKLFHDAGQKYVVITAKHHDGFCLFDSKHTDYTSVKATPFGRDIIKELVEACAKYDLKFGLYYSQAQDWYHPDGDGNIWDFNPEEKDFGGYLKNYVHPQLTELLTNYGDIAVLWFDTPGPVTLEQSKAMLEHVHSIQPNCLINGRVGNGLGDYASAGDNGYMNQWVDMDWECCATMNNTWGYRASDTNFRPVETLIANLERCVKANGNYLLNVGPDDLGNIPQPSVDRLLAIGEHLKSNPISEMNKEALAK